MIINFEPIINLTRTVCAGVHFRTNEIQIYSIVDSYLRGRTTPTIYGEWDMLANEVSYDDGILLDEYPLMNMDMSHIPSFGAYATANIGDKKHIFLVYIGDFGYQDLLWESPESDFGSTSTRKRILNIYMTIQGNGWINLEYEFDGNKKNKIVELPKDETVLKVRLRHKGRLFKFRIFNIIGSQVIIKNPVLSFDVIED